MVDEAAHRSAAELLLEAGAPPESAAGHLLRVAPQADAFVVSTLRQAADRSLAQGAAEAAVGYLTRALEEQLDPAVRAEVLVELGLGERRTNGPAAVDHLRAGLELLADPGRARCGRARAGPRALAHRPDRGCLCRLRAGARRGRSAADPDLHELLVAELISSAWWDPQTYSIAEARLGELDLRALHGGLGSDILLATLAHYEYQQGLHRELAFQLARRALASGNLLASGSIAFLHAVVVLARAGLLDEACSILDHAVAQTRRRGDVFNVAFMLVWRGFCQTRRGDLRAAVADLREAMDLGVAHGLLMAWPYNVGFLAHALLEQGESNEAAHVIDQGGFPSSYQSTRSTPSGFGSTAAASGSRPEARAGRRSCSRLARPLGDTPSTIQAACPGAAGPPRAFDSSTTRKRVRSPTRLARSTLG